MARNWVPGREVAEIISEATDCLLSQGERVTHWILEKVIITKDSNPHNRGPLPKESLLWDHTFCHDRDIEGLVLFRQKGRTGRVTGVLKRFKFEAVFSVYREGPTWRNYVKCELLDQVDEEKDKLLARAGLKD